MQPEFGSNPDPFAFFDQQQFSHELLATLGPQLVGEAAEMVKQDPDAQPVGMLFTADSQFGVALRNGLARAGMPAPPGMPIGVVVPREVAIGWLRYDAEVAAEWFDRARWHEPRMFPAVAMTKDGVSMAMGPYPSVETRAD
jgi:hypothetical protein